MTSDLSTPEITVSDRRLSVIAWTTAAMLLGFLCLTHLGVLVGILTVNALVVAAIHLDWEVMATRTLNRQLVELRDSGKEIDVDLQWFGEPVGRRFKAWGIPYRPVRRDQVKDGPELMSVVAGYPGGIRYSRKNTGQGETKPSPGGL